jgi:hypothetical protein
MGLHGYHLPDMDHIAKLAGTSTTANDVRGGEGHMEVGKLIHFVEDEVNHMTGLGQTVRLHAELGRVRRRADHRARRSGRKRCSSPSRPRAISRSTPTAACRWCCSKPGRSAQAEFEEALAKTGLTEESFRERLARSWYGRHPLRRPKHVKAGTAANLVYALA